MQEPPQQPGPQVAVARPWWQSRWAWFGGLAAAAIAVAAAIGSRTMQEPEPVAKAEHQKAKRRAKPRPRAHRQEEESTAPRHVFADLGSAWDDDDLLSSDLSLDALDGPPGDMSATAWLAATESGTDTPAPPAPSSGTR